MSQYTYVGFRADLANRLAIAAIDLRKINEDGSHGAVMFRAGTRLGISTGHVFSATYAEGQFLEVYNSNQNTFHAFRMNEILTQTYTPSGSEASAVSELDRLLAVQAEIFDSLYAASEIIMRHERAGRDCTHYRNRVKFLYDRLVERNQSLIDSEYITDIQSGQTPLSGFSDSLSRVLNNQPAIGLVPVAILVIKAGVVLVFALIAYYFIKMLLTGGKADLKDARKLVSELAAMDPEAAKDVTKMLGAYYKSFWDKILPVILAVGGIGLLYLFMSDKSNKNKKGKEDVV